MASPISPNVENEYIKNKRVQRIDVDFIMDWAKQQAHLPQITEFEAICFLTKSLYLDAPTKTTIDAFYTAKSTWPQIFLETTILDPKLFEITNYILVTILSEQTPEGYSIIYIKILNEEAIPERASEKIIKYLDSVLLLDLYLNGMKNGYLLLLDMTGADEEKVEKIHHMVFKEYFYYLEELIPISLKGIHFLSTRNYSEDLFWKMQSCLPKALLPKVHGHRSLESLYKYIPLECLPDDYEGDLLSIDKLQVKNLRKLQKHRDFFEWELKQKTNEAKRYDEVRSLFDII